MDFVINNLKNKEMKKLAISIVAICIISCKTKNNCYVCYSHIQDKTLNTDTVIKWVKCDNEMVNSIQEYQDANTYDNVKEKKVVVCNQK